MITCRPSGGRGGCDSEILSLAVIVVSGLLLSCCRTPVNMLPEPSMEDALVCGVEMDAGWDSWADVVIGPVESVERCEGSEDSEDEDLDPLLMNYFYLDN